LIPVDFVRKQRRWKLNGFPSFHLVIEVPLPCRITGGGDQVGSVVMPCFGSQAMEPAVPPACAWTVSRTALFVVLDRRGAG